MYTYEILYAIFISLSLNRTHRLHNVVWEFHSPKDIFWKKEFRQETYMYMKANKNEEWYSVHVEKI